MQLPGSSTTPSGSAPSQGTPFEPDIEKHGVSLAACLVYSERGEQRRIISLRKANRREEIRYAET